MNPQTITALAGLVVFYLTPVLQGIPLLAEAPDALHFVLEGIRHAVTGSLILLVGYFSPSVQERIGKLISPIIAHLESNRSGQSNLDLRKLAIEMVKKHASELGLLGWVFKIPFLGNWIAGSQIDAAASGVKRALKTN